MTEWKTIDSRPPEGEFLAYDPVSGKQDVCRAVVGNSLCEAVQQDGEYGADADEFQGVRATHWAPLPQAPK